jgi:hypothetical protein
MCDGIYVWFCLYLMGKMNRRGGRYESRRRSGSAEAGLE